MSIFELTDVNCTKKKELNRKKLFLSENLKFLLKEFQFEM